MKLDITDTAPGEPMTWNAHGETIFKLPEPPHAITLRSPEGKDAHIDFNGDSVTYRGDLSVDESAKLFFDAVGHLLRGKHD